MPIRELLLKTETEQIYIAANSTSYEILDMLANSESSMVKMTVLQNPSISTNTIERLIDDQDPVVWKRATDLLENRRE